MIKFLIEIKNNNILYRDFKYPNIGFDNYTDLNFIVLDYDEKTIVRTGDELYLECINAHKQFQLNIRNQTNEPPMESLKHTLGYCSGTYLPFIFLFSNDINANVFDKSYSNILASIVINMYFDDNNIRNSLLDFILKQEEIVTNINIHIFEHIDVYIKNPNPNATDKADIIINEMIKDGIPDLTNFNDSFKFINAIYDKTIYLKCKELSPLNNTDTNYNEFLLNLIMNLASINYDTIKYPQELLNDMIDVYLKKLPSFIDKRDINKSAPCLCGGKYEKYKTKYLALKENINK